MMLAAVLVLILITVGHAQTWKSIADQPGYKPPPTRGVWENLFPNYKTVLPLRDGRFVAVGDVSIGVEN